MRARAEWRVGCGRVMNPENPSSALGDLGLRDGFLVAFLAVFEHDWVDLCQESLRLVLMQLA